MGNPLARATMERKAKLQGSASPRRRALDEMVLQKGSGSDEPLERPSRTAPAGQPRHGLERFTAPSFTAPRKTPG